ncbi:MAG: O-antigen ligase family protein [Clostridia bacterium]|nr:O-antigen ligase family protein [Clostridia bacterium]
MESTKENRFLSWLAAIRETKTITKINKFIASPICLAIMAALTLLAYSFSLEVIFYGLVVVFAIYVCLFAEDFMPIVPLFLFCYVTSSPKNNPGRAETSMFYGVGGILIIIFASVAVLALLFRLGTDKNMGFKKLFTTKRSLVWGFLALGIGYVLSGIGSAGYLQVIWKNLFLALLEFLSLFLLYFLFSATINWEKRDKNYFVWMMFFFGVLIVGELIASFLLCNVIEGGVIMRGRISAGWGHYNNMGAMIGVSIPFAMFLSMKYKRGFIFVIVAGLMYLSLFFACSRGSQLGAGLTFAASYVYAAIKTKEKKSFFIASGIFVAVVAILCIVFRDTLTTLFSDVPDIIKSSENGTEETEENLFNDSNRFKTYLGGLKTFINYPIFGESFYPRKYVPYEYSTVDKFSSFFPPRWHNTFIQMLVSCGVVGFAAYVFHRVQTVRLYLKKRDDTTTFFAFGILALLAMSMLDCHFFNLGPGFFYSICLMVIEFAPSDKKKQVAKEEETPSETSTQTAE